MSGWEVNDMALCIRAPGHCFGWHESPVKVGRIYTVERVVIDEYDNLGLGFVDVTFPGCTLNASMASNYRKVTPPAADEFDRQVIEQMNGAPVGEPAL